jgi:pilus assembly protein CpaB
MRAVTVATDPITGVAGFLKPGNRVDILATFEVGRDTIAKTVLQDVELLAIGAEALPPDIAQPAPDASAKGGVPKAEEKPAPKTVDQKTQATATLAVRPDDAIRLVIAATKGNVRLSLRPANEHTFVPVPAMDAYEVIGQRPPELNSSSAPNTASNAAAPPAPKSALPAEPASQPAASASRATGLTRAAPSVEVIRGSQRETVTP